MYNLMVFIDRNYALLNDARTKDKIFLSYCDEFDQDCVGPLLHDHIARMNMEKEHNKSQQETSEV